VASELCFQYRNTTFKDFDVKHVCTAKGNEVAFANSQKVRYDVHR
jgi:hypothetical protein